MVRPRDDRKRASINPWETKHQARQMRALRRHPEIFKRIFSESPIAIILYDSTGAAIAANQSCLDMVGVGDTSNSKLWTNLFRDPTIPADVKEMVIRRQTGRYHTAVNYDHLRARGVYGGATSGVREVDVVVSHLGCGVSGEVLGYMSQTLDVTELKHAEQRLQAYQSQLRRLSAQLARVEEQERRRLATGLHDQVGQNLALVKIRLGLVRDMEPRPAIRQALVEAESLLDHAIRTTRSLTFELSPPVLYELGLAPAIKWMADQFESTHGISCSLQDDGNSRELGDDIRSLLFSAVRELMTNVVKHAQAREVVISIRETEEGMSLTVRDDGVGFDGWDGKGFGLFNIKERLRAAGGRMQVDSKKGCGTTVRLTMPDSAAEGGCAQT